MTENLVRFKQTQSTMVESYKYNYALLELTVHFKNGDSYVYEDVPLDVYSQLSCASSTGLSFNALIKGKYNFRKFVKSYATFPKQHGT